MRWITRRDKIPNRTIRNQIKLIDIIDQIAKAKWRWARQVVRMPDNRLTKRMENGDLERIKKVDVGH